MIKYTTVRITTGTDKKLEKLKNRINKNELSIKNKGEIIDIALTEALEAN